MPWRDAALPGVGTRKAAGLLSFSEVARERRKAQGLAASRASWERQVELVLKVALNWEELRRSAAKRETVCAKVPTPDTVMCSVCVGVGVGSCGSQWGTSGICPVP